MCLKIHSVSLELFKNKMFFKDRPYKGKRKILILPYNAQVPVDWLCLILRFAKIRRKRR